MMVRAVSKYQTTLSGYAAWVVEKHAQLYGRSSADQLRYIVEQWAEQNRDALGDLGLSVKDYAETTEVRVLRHRRAAEGSSE